MTAPVAAFTGAQARAVLVRRLLQALPGDGLCTPDALIADRLPDHG